ncbi:hypothetical protein SAY86_027084 [Trapa natans]|uniref:Uncharacterized protein n=1 Tax=Trapa natans TaxID=22666 RepID=A0AAN7QIP4_TRANT|nr:hypothetical protein SAY86_027084 [Trapa natans]
MEEALLLRTLAAQSSALTGIALSMTRRDTFPIVFSGERTLTVGSPRLTVQSEVSRRTGGIRMALSESDVIKSIGAISGARSLPFAAMLPDVDREDEPASSNLDGGFDEVWKMRGVLIEELEFCGSGSGGGRQSGGYRGSGGDGFVRRRREMGDYYREMLKSYPGDALLLGNYAKYLHEVERDFVRAEEYYGRAILANPGDGEVLSQYGKLIWETQRDAPRAETYFDRAVQASPDDSTVLGSYAHFMWQVDEDEEERKMGDRGVEDSPTASAMAAF